VLLGKVFASALRVGSTVVLVLAFGFMAYACYRRYLDTGSVNMLGLVVINTISIGDVHGAARRHSVSSSPALWLIRVRWNFGADAHAPDHAGSVDDHGNTLQLAGILCIVASLLSLRRSLGIVPAQSRYTHSGPVQRHPPSSLCVGAARLWGFAIANPSLWNFCIWLADCGLQYTRACAEDVSKQ